MKFLKTLLTQKFSLGLVSAVLAMTVVIGFQNCGPVNFKSLSSTEGPNPQSTPDPNPPAPSCDGFWVNEISQVTMPPGQTVMNMNFRGELGTAFGPMKWTITPSGGIPVTAMGINVTMPMSIGTFNVVSTSGDNSCRRSFTLKVQSSVCVSPLASTLDFEVVTPVNDRIEGMPIQFRVNNFSQVQNVRTQWQIAGAFENQTAATFSHTYPAAGTYQITAKANDKVCPENELVSSLPITVRLRDCSPATTQISFSPLTPNPSANTTVSFNVNNFALLQDGKVDVEWAPGVVKSYTSNPVSHTYPSVTTDTPRSIIFRAKAKEAAVRCQLPLQAMYNHTQLKPCVPQFNRINVTTNPAGPAIFTTTPVVFNTSHVATDFTYFQWDLGNGQTGTTLASFLAAIGPASNRIPQFYSQPSNPKAVFLAGGPKTCDEGLRLEIPFVVSRETFPLDFRILQDTVTPPVKMFFIVDNSETMANEQTFLPAAYNQMFVAGGSNLRGFDVESSIFTTAQYVDSSRAHLTNPTSDDYISNIPSQSVATLTNNRSYNFIYDRKVVSAGYVTGWRFTNMAYGPTLDYGELPGDVIGLLRSTSSLSSIYSLAPVYGITPGANGPAAAPVVLSPKLHIGPNAQQAEIDGMQLDFANRVKLLNPEAYSNPNHQKEYFRVTMRENQHCAMARVLKNSDQYMTRGSKPTFVVVTDENETGIDRYYNETLRRWIETPYDYMDGRGCVESAGQTTYYQGYCGTYGTKFTFDTGNFCEVRWASSSQARYSYDMKKTYYSYTVRVCEINDTGGCNYHNEYRSDDRNGWPSGVTAAGPISRAVCEEFIGVAGDSNYVAGTADCDAVSQAAYATVWVNGYHPYGESNDSWCSGRPDFVPSPTNTCTISGHNYSIDRVTPINDACPSSLCDGKGNCSANLQTDQTEHFENTPGLSCESCMSGSGASCTTWQEYFMSQYNSNGGCYASPFSIRQGQDFEVTNEQNVCPAGQHWTRTGTATRSGVTFVTGTQSNGSPVPLRTYIKSRINEIVANGVLSPTIVSFVKTTTTAGDPGSKVDTNMKQTMIEVMGNTSLPVPEGGTVNLYNSVYDTANYANAFQQFASFIRKTLIRTYNLPIVIPTGKTLVIQSVSKNGAQLVLGTDYTVDIPNKRITFKDSLAVTPNDQIRVVYFFM